MGLFKNINFDRLKDGLNKTREKIVTRIQETVSGKAKLDDATLEEIEDILLTSDIGYDTAQRIIENTRKSLKGQDDRSSINVLEEIKNELSTILDEYVEPESEYDKLSEFKPYVIIVVGVNGAGKTTTIGKLAHNYKSAGLKVVIGSADTFRAAANEQLEVWAERAGVDIVQRRSGTDPSSVAYDTLNIAKSKGADIVLIDTAGRLHTKTNLMEELNKIDRVLKKVLPYAPNETFLVLDGNTGQNAIRQYEEFSKYIRVTGLVITKLDGTAKGGVVFQICREKEIPLRYIGVGESIEDLQAFDSKSYVEALFGKA